MTIIFFYCYRNNSKLGQVLSFANHNYKHAERNTRNERGRVNGNNPKGKSTIRNAYQITYERSGPMAHVKLQRVRGINSLLFF